MKKNKLPKLLYRDGSPMRTHKSKIIEELMNEDKQQTTVDWLQSKVLYIVPSSQKDDLLKLFEQAKEMEKEQHYTTWLTAQMNYPDDDYVGITETFEKYYNQNYGK